MRLAREQPVDAEPHPFAVALDDISLDVRGGEIVVIAGVAGNGQDELFDALSGERAPMPRRR